MIRDNGEGNGWELVTSIDETIAPDFPIICSLRANLTIKARIDNACQLLVILLLRPLKASGQLAVWLRLSPL